MEIVKATQDLIVKMKYTGIFRLLGEDEIKLAQEFISFYKFIKGEVIIKEGSRSYGLYTIVQGKVKALKQGIEIATLYLGDFFGESDLLQIGPASATIVADDDTIVAVVSKDAINNLETQNSKTALKFYKLIAKVIMTRLVNLDNEYVKVMIELDNQKKKEEMRKVREEIFRIGASKIEAK